MDKNDLLSNEKKCTNCGGLITSFENISFRKGGLTGFLSQMGEIFEGHLKTNCYKCSNCGHLDFYESSK